MRYLCTQTRIISNHKRSIENEKYLDPKADLAFKKIFGEHSKALETVEESALTKEERLAYDDFWDKLGAERLLFIDSNKISHEEGRAEGRAEGKANEKIESAKRYLAMGLTTEQVAQGSELPLEEVLKLVQSN